MPLFSLTFLALVAFAANSLLCRLALSGDVIDPVPFTVLRLASGALFLAFLMPPTRSELSGWRHSLGAATGLFIYAFFFSLAYVSMDTGAGALVLFATIQIAMNTIALRGGANMNYTILAGILIAFAGLVWLLLPGQNAPDPIYAGMMMLAGAGWTGFVYYGRNNKQPIKEVALAFRWAIFFCIPAALITDWGNTSLYGATLAILSGVVASGMGYAVWYKVLPQLGMQNAAQAQLAVPVLAVVMGYLVLDEAVTLAMIGASVLILAGIIVALRGSRSPGKS